MLNSQPVSKATGCVTFKEMGSRMLKGVLAMIGASVIMGSLPTINKYILLSGMSSGCNVFYAMLTVAIGSAFIILLTKKSFKVSFKAFCMMFILGSIGMGGTGFLLNISYEYIAVGLATMLHFMYPSLVCILMIIMFQQKLTKLKVGAIVLSVFGMFLILDLSGNVKFIGIIAAILSCISYSFYIIANERGSINELPLIVKLFYVSLAGAIVFGIQTVTSGNFSLPTNNLVYFLMFGLSGLGCLIAFYLMISGIKILGASTAAFFNMLEPIISMFVSILFFNDNMSTKTILGSILVVSSVLLISFDGTKNLEPNLYELKL